MDDSPVQHECGTCSPMQQGGALGTSHGMHYQNVHNLQGVICACTNCHGDGDCAAVAANIAIVGLSLYQVGFDGVSKCYALGIPMIGLIIIFSQYLRRVAIPLPGKLRRSPLPSLSAHPVTFFCIRRMLTFEGCYGRCYICDCLRSPLPGNQQAPYLGWED